MACDLNFIVKDEGLLKVTVSHVYWKSGNISKTVLDRDIRTGNQHEVIFVYGLSNKSNYCNDLECP